jgi:DNA modification methylase
VSEPYYADERVMLYLGDALEIMPTLRQGAADLIVTDPPYIIGAVSAGSLASKSGGWADMMNSSLWFAAWYKQAWSLLRHVGAMWSFCNWRTIPVIMRAAIDAGVPLTSMMVWDKEWIGPGGSQGLRPAYEMCALFAKPAFSIPDRGIPDVWRHKVGSYKDNGHPAEKPVNLMRRIIRASGSVDLVVDPFMGSGTSIIAASLEDKRSIGIEAEEKWCEIAAKRLAQGVLDFDEVPA